MEQRVSLITLGVDDLARSISFYEALGWVASPKSVAGEVAFFQAGGVVIALWSRAALAADSGVTDAGGWGGVVLAHNVVSTAEVDELLAVAEAAGARITRWGSATEWGGYSGLFIDLDGHPWEIAVNPDWQIQPDGSIRLE